MEIPDGKWGICLVLTALLALVVLPDLGIAACDPVCNACQDCVSDACQAKTGGICCGGNWYAGGNCCSNSECGACKKCDGEKKCTGLKCGGGGYNCAVGNANWCSKCANSNGDNDANSCVCKGGSWKANKCCGDDGSNDDYCSGTSYCFDGSWYTDPDKKKYGCQTCASKVWLNNKCCGDDGASVDYCAGSTNFCLDGVKYTDPDKKKYGCETCASKSWLKSKCCGDDGGATDTYCDASGKYCESGTLHNDPDESEYGCVTCGSKVWLSNKCCGDDGGSTDTYCGPTNKYCDSGVYITDYDQSSYGCQTCGSKLWSSQETICCGDDGGATDDFCAATSSWYCLTGSKTVDGDDSKKACTCILGADHWARSTCCDDAGEDFCQSATSGAGTWYCDDGAREPDADTTQPACDCEAGSNLYTTKNSGNKRCCGGNAEEAGETWCESPTAGSGTWYCDGAVRQDDADYKQAYCDCEAGTNLFTAKNAGANKCCGGVNEEAAETWCESPTAGGGDWYCDGATRKDDADVKQEYCDCEAGANLYTTNNAGSKKCCGGTNEEAGETWCENPTSGAGTWYCDGAVRMDDADYKQEYCDCEAGTSLFTAKNSGANKCCGGVNEEPGEVWCESPTPGDGDWYCDGAVRVDDADTKQAYCDCEAGLRLYTTKNSGASMCCGGTNEEPGETWCESPTVGDGAWYCDGAVRVDDADSKLAYCDCEAGPSLYTTKNSGSNRCCGGVNEEAAETWCESPTASDGQWYCDGAVRVDDADVKQAYCDCEAGEELYSTKNSGADKCCGGVNEEPGETWCESTRIGDGAWYCDNAVRKDDADSKLEYCECEAGEDLYTVDNAGDDRCCGGDVGEVDTWCSNPVPGGGEWYCDTNVRKDDADLKRDYCDCEAGPDLYSDKNGGPFKCCGGVNEEAGESWCESPNPGDGAWYCDNAVREDNADDKKEYCDCKAGQNLFTTDNPSGENRCCGGDTETDTWCSSPSYGSQNWYCNENQRTDEPDFDQPACRCMTPNGWWFRSVDDDIDTCCGDDAGESWCGLEEDGYCLQAAWFPVADYDDDEHFCTACAGNIWESLYDLSDEECCGDDPGESWCGDRGYCLEGVWHPVADPDDDAHYCEQCVEEEWREGTCCGDDVDEKWCGTAGYCYHGDYHPAIGLEVFARETPVYAEEACATDPLRDPFNQGSCAESKTYEVFPGASLDINIFTCSLLGCHCTYPMFDLFDTYQGLTYLKGRYQDLPQELGYATHIRLNATGERVRISATTDQCFYSSVTLSYPTTMCDVCDRTDGCFDHIDKCQVRQTQCHFCLFHPENCTDELIGGLEGCLYTDASNNNRCLKCARHLQTCQRCLDDEECREHFDLCIDNTQICDGLLNTDMITFQECFFGGLTACRETLMALAGRAALLCEFADDDLAKVVFMCNVPLGLGYRFEDVNNRFAARRYADILPLTKKKELTRMLGPAINEMVANAAGETAVLAAQLQDRFPKLAQALNATIALNASIKDTATELDFNMEEDLSRALDYGVVALYRLTTTQEYARTAGGMDTALFMLERIQDRARSLDNLRAIINNRTIEQFFTKAQLTDLPSDDLMTTVTALRVLVGMVNTVFEVDETKVAQDRLAEQEGRLRDAILATSVSGVAVDPAFMDEVRSKVAQVAAGWVTITITERESYRLEVEREDVSKTALALKRRTDILTLNLTEDNLIAVTVPALVEISVPDGIEYYWSLFTIRLYNAKGQAMEDVVVPYRVKKGVTHSIEELHFDRKVKVLDAVSLVAWEVPLLEVDDVLELKFVAKKGLCRTVADCKEGEVCDNIHPLGVCNTQCTACGTVCDSGDPAYEVCNGNGACVAESSRLDKGQACQCNEICASNLCTMGVCCAKGEFADPINMVCSNKLNLLLISETQFEVILGDSYVIAVHIANPSGVAKTFTVRASGVLADNVMIFRPTFVLQPWEYRQLLLQVTGLISGKRTLVIDVEEKDGELRDSGAIDVVVRSPAQSMGVEMRTAPGLTVAHLALLGLLAATAIARKPIYAPRGRV